MIVFNENKGAVDPIALASFSRRFRPAIPALPPVIQPALLTDQLRGCGCRDCCGPQMEAYISSERGMDAYDPGVGMDGLGTLGLSAEEGHAFIAALKSFIDEMKSLWADLEAALGIGAGRREADVIVPVQEKIVSEFIAPVSDYLTQINNHQITPTCVDLQVWQQSITNVQANWLAYLHNTEWMDGRAAQQAEATLAPYFTNAKRDLAKYQQQYCGVFGGIGGGILTTPSGDINWPVVALGGGLLYMLVKSFGR